MKARTLVSVSIFLFVVSVIFTFSSCGNDDGHGIAAALDAYYWESLGSPGEGYNSASAIVIDPSDNKPIIVFQDLSGGGSIPHVMKWSSGTSWTDLGTLPSGEQCTITVDPADNKPIVACGGGADATVMKWDIDTTWTDLGFPSTGWTKGAPSITIDPSDNKPVVAVHDDDNDGKILVMKWDIDTTWIGLGFASTGEGISPSIAIDPSDNKPVVAYVDVANGEKTHVMKWDSVITWTDLGFPSTVATYGTVIAIDPSDNKPVVAYVDESSGGPSGVGGVQVKKWSSGTSWTDLGYPSPSRSENPSIAIDPTDNKPIVAIRDFQGPMANPSTTFIHVKKWSDGTSWTGLGFPSEVEGVVSSITIDPSDNKPVVIYTDTGGPGERVYVAKHP
jgi:hypothetical protein